MSELSLCCFLAFVVATGGGSLRCILAPPRALGAHIAGVDTPEAATTATVGWLGGRGPRQIGARDTRCLWAIRTLPAA
jgi:hypothetical protein